MNELLAGDSVCCRETPLKERVAIDVIVLRAREDQVLTDQCLCGSTILLDVGGEVRPNYFLRLHEILLGCGDGYGGPPPVTHATSTCADIRWCPKASVRPPAGSRSMWASS